MPFTTPTSLPVSAVPAFYYIVFGIVEPLITFASLLEGIFDPWKVCTLDKVCYRRKLRGTNQVINRHGHQWQGAFAVASGVPPTTVHAIVCQMVVAHAIIGFVNASVLRAIRRLPSPTLQEKIAKSLLIPLAIGDVSYLFWMFYGIGDIRWRSRDWPQALRLNVIVGIAIFIPRYVRVILILQCKDDWSHCRVCWILGIGRYAATRDSRLDSRS